jgi:hypothetical protein
MAYAKSAEWLATLPALDEWWSTVNELCEDIPAHRGMMAWRQRLEYLTHQIVGGIATGIDPSPAQELFGRLLGVYLPDDPFAIPGALDELHAARQKAYWLVLRCREQGIGAAPGELQEAALTVNLPRQQVTYKGERFDVPSAQALRWLQVLVNHPGEWIAASELHDYDSELVSVRTDKLLPHLPEVVRGMIERKTGAGSRLKPPA